MEHIVALTKLATIRVDLLRSTKSYPCPQCSRRRILIAVVLRPVGLSPETWMCAECLGLRIPGVTISPSPLSGGPTLWDEAAASVALDHDEREGTHYVGDGHDHDDPEAEALYDEFARQATSMPEEVTHDPA